MHLLTFLENYEFEVFSDNEDEIKKTDKLGLDMIDQYINQDIFTKEKCLNEQKITRIPKFGERSKTPVFSSK